MAGKLNPDYKDDSSDEDEVLKEAIREICSNTSDIENLNCVGDSAGTKKPFANERCCTVMLSSAPSAGKCCPNLRCIKCDLPVQTFENFAWKCSTDYIFLRNNFPDFDKLKPQLRMQRGCCAYSCQCTWVNITAVTDVASDSSLKWVCARH